MQPEQAVLPPLHSPQLSSTAKPPHSYKQSILTKTVFFGTSKIKSKELDEKLFNKQMNKIHKEEEEEYADNWV